MKLSLQDKRFCYALIALVLVSGIAIRAFFSSAKDTWHVDEGMTVALTNGSWAPGAPPPSEDEWISADELHNLAFNYRMEASKKVEFEKIKVSTAYDVHPPLYYWVFAVLRQHFGVRNYLFSGYLLNILLFIISAAILAMIVQSVFKEPLTVLFALCIFAFSSGALSVTIFLRMYELLQTLCLIFFGSALLVLHSKDSRGDTTVRVVSLALGSFGLAVSAYCGLLTQYYFLLFIVPVCAYSFVHLVIKKDFTSLLWAVFAVFAGLFFAYKTFPPMLVHLTKSYRAGQSFHNLANTGLFSRLNSLFAYQAIISKNLVPFILVIALVVFAVIIARKNKKSGMAQHKADMRIVSLFTLSMTVLLFTWFVISMSAPYKTVRYVVSFFPVYLLAFIALTHMLLSKRNAHNMLAISALWVTLHGVIPANLCHFHEDYPLEENAYYMKDNTPLVIMATPEGGRWKNMLLYINLRGERPIFVTEKPMGVDVTAALSDIVRESGYKTAYAIVDDYYRGEIAHEKIGFYGFYNVYKVITE